MPAISKGDLPAPGAQALAPAYYAPPSTGWRRDLLALLHPPYTAWHLSYVVIGASLAPHLDLLRLAATVVAFFFAVGISAHALDELHGRPLRTSVPSSVLIASAAIGLVIAVGLGIAGVTQVGIGLLAFIALGVLFVVVYNLELLGGRLHGDMWFSLSWGAFPVVTAYFAQTGRLSLGALAVAAAAYALSYGQHRPRPASTAQTARAGAESVLVGSRGACARPGPFASALDRRHSVLARWSR